MRDDRVVLFFGEGDPGIEDLRLVPCPGCSTSPDWARDLGFGEGMGIPNMEKNPDVFVLRSRPGKGTAIRATIFGRMRVEEVVHELRLEALSLPRPHVEVTGGYCYDLLSRIMVEAGYVWIAYYRRFNVVTVAKLKGLSTMVLARGPRPDVEVISRPELPFIPGKGVRGMQETLSLLIAKTWYDKG